MFRVDRRLSGNYLSVNSRSGQNLIEPVGRSVPFGQSPPPAHPIPFNPCHLSWIGAYKAVELV